MKLKNWSSCNFKNSKITKADIPVLIDKLWDMAGMWGVKSL